MPKFSFITADQANFNAVLIDVVTQTAKISIGRDLWASRMRGCEYDSNTCETALNGCSDQSEGIEKEFENWLAEEGFTEEQILILQDEVATQAMELVPILKILATAQDTARFNLYEMANDMLSNNYRKRVQGENYDGELYYNQL